MRFGEVEVILGNLVEADEHVTVRVVQVSVGEEKLVVNHFHFGSWMDSEPPQVSEEDSGCDSLKMIIERSAKFITDHNQKAQEGKEYRKLLVMCPDGLERTGAVLALIHATITMSIQRTLKWEKDLCISVFSVVRRIQ